MRKGDETFEAAACARVAGEIDDNEFLKRTLSVWRTVAARLWKRWRRKLPPDIGIDDVQQALMILAVRYVKKCNPARFGAKRSYGGYIVWCAMRRTVRQIHKWRNAKLSGQESKNPGRFERNFSSLRRADDERREDYESRIPGESQDPVERLEADRVFRENLALSQSVREALVLLALRRAEGSIDGAAEEIWRSYPARIECGVRDVKHARRLIRDVLEALAPDVVEAIPEPAYIEDVYPDDDLFDFEDDELDEVAA